MRIRRHRLAIMLLGAAVPHQFLATGDSSSLIVGNDTSIDDSRNPQQQKQQDNHCNNNKDEDHDNCLTTTTNDILSRQQHEDVKKEESQHRNPIGSHEHQEERLLHDEEKIISKQYSSSSTKERSGSDSTVQACDYKDDDKDDTDLISATQTVHEDVINNDDDIDCQAQKSSSAETHDESFVEEKEIQFDSKSVSGGNDYIDENDIDNYQSNNDVDNNKALEDERIVEIVVVEEENLIGYGTVGTTNTEEEVEDDEVVFVVVTEKENNLVGYRTTGTSTEESTEDDCEHLCSCCGKIIMSGDDDEDDIDTTINETTDDSTASDQSVTRSYCNDSDCSFDNKNCQGDTNNARDEINSENDEERKYSNLDNNGTNDDDNNNDNNNKVIPVETSSKTATKETEDVEGSNNNNNNNETSTDDKENKIVAAQVAENNNRNISNDEATATTSEANQITREKIEDLTNCTLDDNDVEIDSEYIDNKLKTDDEKADPNESMRQEIVDENNEDTLGLNQVVESNGKNESEKEEINTTIVDDDDEDLTDRVSVDYASKSAGALIIEKTSEMKGTSNLMIGDSDKYAIVPCSEERKYVVLSLSEDILVKVIKLANYERFSSTVKDFQVKGSHTLGNWADLGTYRAESGNGEQIFTLDNPTWARYLKFKFLTHHGVEYYCTLSQIQVHGSNMVQGFHEQWESIEENNEEYVQQSKDDTGEMKEDTNEKTDGVSINIEEDVGSRNVSNSSDIYIENPDTPVGDLDVITEVRSKSNNDGSNHSVRSNSNLNPLGHFQSHLTFSEILQGGKDADELFFTDLYELIPSILSVQPLHSRNAVKSEKQENCKLNTVHHISQLAIESLYSFGSRLVSGDVSILATEDDVSSISSPKMNDFSEGYAQKRFGSGLSFMMNTNLSNSIGHSSIINKSSRNQATDESNESPDEFIIEVIGEISGVVLEDGSSKSTTNKATSTPINKVEKVAVVETNDYTDLVIANLLKDLPSAECLVNLNYAEFKAKVSAARKSTTTSSSSQSTRSGMMEPIFKKLTDEIFALQTSLSVHDQFTKMSISCYQRVVLDLAIEMDKLRRGQEERLSRLEEQISEPASMRMIKKLLISVVYMGATWFISNWSHLVLFVKNSVVPMIPEILFSNDTHAKFNSTLYLFRDQWYNLGEDLSIKANGWTQSSKYKDFFSAWSTYYDGGMAVVVIVFTLLLCRIVMFCSSIHRRKCSSQGKIKQPCNNATNRSGANIIHTSKSQKEKSRKNRKKSKEKTSQIEMSLKDLEEIPELQDEIHQTNCIPNRSDARNLISVPSIVSLDG